jgi:hypothetical protein
VEATDTPYPVGCVTEYVGREVDDAAAVGALRVEMSGWHRLVHHVVGRESAIEMHVSEDANLRETVERSIDGCPMHTRAPRGHLVQHFFGRQVITAGSEHAAEHGDSRLRDPLSRSPEQSLGSFVEALLTYRHGH